MNLVTNKVREQAFQLYGDCNSHMEGTVYVNPWGQTVPSMFQEEQGDRHAQSGWSEWMLVANETREVADDWIMWRLEDHAKSLHFENIL